MSGRVSYATRPSAGSVRAQERFRPKCEHVTLSGRRCKFVAVIFLYGKRLCRLHS